MIFFFFSKWEFIEEFKNRRGIYIVKFIFLIVFKIIMLRIVMFVVSLKVKMLRYDWNIAGEIMRSIGKRVFN